MTSNARSNPHEIMHIFFIKTRPASEEFHRSRVGKLDWSNMKLLFVAAACMAVLAVVDSSEVAQKAEPQSFFLQVSGIRHPDVDDG